MSTFAKSSTRVMDQTTASVNERIARRGAINVHYYATHPELIDKRLAELDTEWDIERWLQFNSSVLTLLGLGLALKKGRGWLLLPLAVQGFFMQHAVQGWCPPLSIMRRLGFRAEVEIQAERYALMAVRGDLIECPDPL